MSQSFVYGAFVLLLASLFNRVVGFIYQVLLIHLIQPEGVGLFNMVYPVYILVLVLATAGIPVAIAKLMAEEVARGNIQGAYRVFTVALFWITVNSLFFTTLLLTGIPFLYYIFPNPKVYYCFMALAPAILIVSLCSAFRGFFQGLQQMVPTAVTQVVEQVVRVITGLSAALFFLPLGIEFAATGISLGVVVGELAGFLLMLSIYFQRRPVSLTPKVFNLPAPWRDVSMRIFQLAIPVTLTRFVSTAFLSIDALLIPRRLQAAGMNVNEATGVYGQFVGIAEPLLFTPSIVTVSLSTALVPAISDALAKNNLSLVRGRTEEALRLTMMAGLPAVAVFALLPRELCYTVFGYAEAGIALGTLALGGPFLYLQQTTTGILQGLGRAERPLRNLVIASVFKIAGIYYLTALPFLTIRGTAISLCLSYVVMSLLNYRDLKRLIGLRLDLSYCLGKPLAATLGMAAVLWYARKVFMDELGIPRWDLLAVLFCGGLSYVIFLLLLGGLHGHDLRRLVSFFSWRR